MTLAVMLIMLNAARADVRSFAVPEGNYNVTVTVGDASAACDATVKAESRRLMLRNVVIKPGETVSRTFTVNVRTPQIPGGGNVKLKDREKDSLDWDDNLSLEFLGQHPGVQHVEIAPAPDAITLYIAGDSTVTDQASEPWAGWGQILPCFFKPGVAVANHAQSGESLKSFAGAKRREKVLSQIKKGDYLFIQFGHNDMKEKGEGVGAFTTFSKSLRDFVTAAREKQAVVVLLTPMNRRTFDDEGKITNTHGDYPEATRRVASEMNLPLIDLNVMSKMLYEAWGPEASTGAFVHYPAGTFPGQSEALKDNSHFNAYGAYELARCVVEGIRVNQLDLARFINDDVSKFDPAHPDPVEAIRIPASPTSAPTTKPAGS